jgi:hypothetical protein
MNPYENIEYVYGNDWMLNDEQVNTNDMKGTGLFNREGKELNIGEVLAMLPIATINRIEVIDENGRSYVNWKPTNRIKLSIQDNGRTLKVFVSKIN